MLQNREKYKVLHTLGYEGKYTCTHTVLRKRKEHWGKAFSHCYCTVTHIQGNDSQTEVHSEKVQNYFCCFLMDKQKTMVERYLQIHLYGMCSHK